MNKVDQGHLRCKGLISELFNRLNLSVHDIWNPAPQIIIVPAQ
jgi:hypothetical protein